MCLLVLGVAPVDRGLAREKPPAALVQNFSDLTDRIVRIRALKSLRIDPQDSGQLIAEYDYGTGVVLRHRGLVVTAHHLIGSRPANAEGEREVTIMTRRSGGYVPAEVIAEDAGADVALLRANPRALPKGKFFDPVLGQPPKIGAAAYVIGIRAGAPPESFEVGIIAGQLVDARSQLVDVGGEKYRAQEYMTFSQKILPGYSGGAIVDRTGSLVGIVLGAPFLDDEWIAFSFGVGVAPLMQLLKDLS